MVDAHCETLREKTKAYVARLQGAAAADSAALSEARAALGAAQQELLSLIHI